MKDDSKHALKVSYRVNGYIKSIIDRTNRDIRRKTGLDVSRGKIARTFWSAISENPRLKEKCVNCVCKKILEEENAYDPKKIKNK